MTTELKMNNEQKLSALKGWATDRKLKAKISLDSFLKETKSDPFKYLERLEVLFDMAVTIEVAEHILSVLEHDSVLLVNYYIVNAVKQKGVGMTRGSKFKQTRSAYEVEEWIRVNRILEKWADTGYISNLPG